MAFEDENASGDGPGELEREEPKRKGSKRKKRHRKEGDRKTYGRRG